MSIEGQRLGEYEILELLGKGGMGAVYKARQISLGRFAALKTLEATLASDPEYIARFRQESKAAAMLNHPNLVQVYSAGETAGQHWFAMEFVEGETARMRLKRKGRLDARQALAIAIHVAMALEHGWRKAGLIHRDVKPDNILLSSDGEVKLGDLGLAKSLEQASELTSSGSSMGTPHFMSPEQIENMKDVDFRADIYSLGCTLYYLLAGQPPYAGNSSTSIMLQHISGMIPDLRSVWPQCPANLAGTVQKMMRKKPAARQQNYEELLAHLRRAYDDVGNVRPSVPVIPASSTKEVRSPDRKKPAARSAAFLAAVAGASTISVVALALLFLHFRGNVRPVADARPRDAEQAIRNGVPDPTPTAEAAGSSKFPAPASNSSAAVAAGEPTGNPGTRAVPVSPPIEPRNTPPNPQTNVGLDTSFGDGGKVTTALGPEDNSASTVAVQDDGKILIAGFAYDGTAWNLRIVRYNTDGKVDRRFDSDDGGIRMVSKTLGSARGTLAIQRDHKIVVTGFCHIARYNPDGSLDSSFGELGIVSKVSNATRDITIQPDGKIVVAGHWSFMGSYKGANKFAISRYDTDGRLDSSFNRTGTVMTSFGDDDDICQCVTSQADGKIIAGGYTSLPALHDRAFALVRYNADGSLDTSFNGTGKVTTDLTKGDDEAEALTVQEDGKILAVGFSTGGVRSVVVVRYNIDGSLDTTFNGTGKVMTAIGSGAIGHGVAVLPDGRIVVGGTSNNGKSNLMLVRYHPDGSLDTTLQDNGTAAASIGAGMDLGLCLALQKDGKALVAGRTNNGKHFDSVIVRFLNGTGATGKH